MRLFDLFLKGLHRPLRLALRRPRTVLWIAGALALVCASGLPRLQFASTLDDLLDSTFKTASAYKELGKNFGSRLPLVLVVSPKGADRRFTDAELSDIRDWLAELPKKLPKVQSTRSPFDLYRPIFQGSMLFYTPLLGEGPEGKWEGWDELLRSPWNGNLVSSKRTDLIAWISFRSEKFSSADVKRVMDHWEQGTHSPGIQAQWLGPGVYPYYMKQAVVRDAVLGNTLLVVLLLVVFRLVFGSWKGGLLLAGSVTWTCACVYGAMGWAGTRIDPVTNSLFAMTAIAALEDFVFLSFAQLDGRSRSMRAFVKLIVPAFLTSFTTFAGFASLWSSDFKVIRQLGIWAGLAALLEFVAVYWVLPSVILQVPSLRDWTRRDRSKGLEWLARLRDARVPAWAGKAALIVFPLAAYFATQLLPGDLPNSVFTKGHPYYEANDAVVQSRGWQGQVSVLFAPGAERRFLPTIAQLPGVVTTDSGSAVTDYLTAGVDPKRKPAVLADLERRGALKQYHAADGRDRAVIFVASHQGGAIRELVSRVNAICGSDCEVTGNPVANAELSERLPHALLESLVMSMALVGLVIIGLALLVRSRSWPHLLVSSFWGPAGMMILVGAFQIRLNFLSCIFASVLVGLTGDNAIQFLWAARKGEISVGVRQRGSAAILCSLLMVGGAMTFSRSEFEPLRGLGILLGAGFAIALVGDLWVLKGLTRTPRRLNSL